MGWQEEPSLRSQVMADARGLGDGWSEIPWERPLGPALTLWGRWSGRLDGLTDDQLAEVACDVADDWVVKTTLNAAWYTYSQRVKARAGGGL
jgi:hypothetical protein